MGVGVWGGRLGVKPPPPPKHPKSCVHSLAHARASIARCSSPGHSGFVGLQALGSEMQVGEPRPLCTHGPPMTATLAHACARMLTLKSRQAGTRNESKQRLHTGPSPFAHPPNLTSPHPPPSLHAPPTLTHSLACPSHPYTLTPTFTHNPHRPSCTPLPPLHAASPLCTLPPALARLLFSPPLHTPSNSLHTPVPPLAHLP